MSRGYYSMKKESKLLINYRLERFQLTLDAVRVLLGTYNLSSGINRIYLAMLIVNVM